MRSASRIVVKTAVVLLFFAAVTAAQSPLPQTGAVITELLTGSLGIDGSPQDIEVRLTVTGGEEVRRVTIGLEDIPATLSLLAATGADGDLWLIRSGRATGREDVLAWSFADSLGKLMLYPSFGAPVDLTLSIRVDLASTAVPDTLSRGRMSAEAMLPSGSYRCSEQGRGNEFSLIQTSEQ